MGWGGGGGQTFRCQNVRKIPHRLRLVVASQRVRVAAQLHRSAVAVALQRSCVAARLRCSAVASQFTWVAAQLGCGVLALQRGCVAAQWRRSALGLRRSWESMASAARKAATAVGSAATAVSAAHRNEPPVPPRNVAGRGGAEREGSARVPRLAGCVRACVGIDRYSLPLRAPDNGAQQRCLPALANPKSRGEGCRCSRRHHHRQ